MASDEAKGGRSPRRTAGVSGFMWVSSSPSPAVVARLEARFPDIVCVPAEDLEAGMEEWLGKTVIARSYQRWVPADAFLREFRRAGVAGKIEPISLANRCHFFRFEDSEACAMVLQRPWVVNGQAIGTEAWHPEFFPADDSVGSALLWLRLPNLPLEFWNSEVLRRIVEPAGSMVLVDAATLAKNRGAFARVCVRVDLCSPLRPGTRVQGVHGTFWQQFSFENLEGICMNCGSMHLKGSCSAPVGGVGEVPDDGPVYGPWVAAVRQRRAAADHQDGMNRPSQVKGAASGGVQGGSGTPVKEPGMSSQAWQFPGKVARRRNAGQMKGKLQLVASSASSGEPQGEKSVIISTVHKLGGRAGFIDKGKGLLSEATVGSCLGNSSLVVSPNPFSALGQLSTDGDDLGGRKAGVGPLKRARPEVNFGKAVLPSPVMVFNAAAGQGDGQAGSFSISSVDGVDGRPAGQNSGLLSSDPTARPGVLKEDSDVLMSSSVQNSEGRTDEEGCLDECAMVEDQELVTSSAAS